eukprot:7383552-Prymnesium_polylepis.2
MVVGSRESRASTLTSCTALHNEVPAETAASQSMHYPSIMQAFTGSHTHQGARQRAPLSHSAQCTLRCPSQTTPRSSRGALPESPKIPLDTQEPKPAAQPRATPHAKADRYEPLVVTLPV